MKSWNLISKRSELQCIVTSWYSVKHILPIIQRRSSEKAAWLVCGGKSLLTYSGKNEKQKLLFTLAQSVLIRFGSSEDANHSTLLSVADDAKKLCSSNNKQRPTVWCSGAYMGLFVYSVFLFKCTHSEKTK